MKKTAGAKQNRETGLSLLPSVDEIVRELGTRNLRSVCSHRYSVHLIRQQVMLMRRELQKGAIRADCTRKELTDKIIDAVTDRMIETEAGSLVPAVNATGVILHTGLGRAPLSPAAVKKVHEILRGYSTLEINRRTGKRGRRGAWLEEILCFLSGAEAAAVVNNNAAAVLTVLNTLASGREVPVSRGELVEIGGSFRMPDIMAASGARMIEVGTTNKTRLSDYEEGITEHTGAILVVHSSNFRVMGFAESAHLKDICRLAKAKRIPVVYDLGGGVLHDLRSFGLPFEPVVSDSIAAGASVVTFSGDKVMGGPQSGIIVGRKKYIDRIKKNPLARAVRCDKLILAALEGTLQTYLTSRGFSALPSTKMLTEKAKNTKNRAERVLSGIRAALKGKHEKILRLSVAESEAEAGSGALPLERLPSYALTLAADGVKADTIARSLRMNTPPIVGYIKNDTVYLDMRTVFNHQTGAIVSAVTSLVTQMADRRFR